MNAELMCFGRMMAVSDDWFVECCEFCGNELCSCLDPDINPDSSNYGLVILSIEEWEHHFKPVNNHIDTESSFDGIMFETTGSEYDYVAAIGHNEPNRIWTYIDKEDGTTVIINHWGFEGRIGYFITEKPYDDMLNIQVQLDQE
jgi:hypothetical protein